MNTVLVATERDLEQNVLAQALDGRGYQIIRSRDGLDALEAARSKSPHVILVNVALPKLDGFALYRRFQQDEQLRRIPIVLFSTRSNDQKSERFAQELGAVRFVGNALKPGALDGVVEAALAAAPISPLPKVQPAKPRPQLEVVVSNAAVPAKVAEAPEPVRNAVSANANGQANVQASSSSASATPAIDRTLKLPALIALPDTEELEKLQAEQAQLQKTLQATQQLLQATQQHLQVSQQQLQDTQQQVHAARGWRDLFDNSPAAMWIVNRATQKIMAVNAVALKLFVYSHDEFMQLDSPAMLRDQTQVTTTTHVFGFRSKDGRNLSLLVNSCEVVIDAQTAELWVAHDVGYRVRGERAMADEVQRVKALLAALPLAYVVIDADGNVRDLNSACSALFELGRDQLLEQSLERVLGDAQQLAALKVLAAGQSLSAAVRQAGGGQRAIQFTAGQHAFGAGLRLFVLQIEREPVTVFMPAPVAQVASKLPLVLEVLRYAEDADEATLLQYAMAQLANAFESPLAIFASLERITQTMDVIAVNHAQTNRRQTNGSVPVPTQWRTLSMPRATTLTERPAEALQLEGLPAVTNYAVCPISHGHELWLLAIANRDAAYTTLEQRELQECAEILIAALVRKRQLARLTAQVQRGAAGAESMLGLLEKLMDAHDPYAAGSSQRVAFIATAVGKQLGLTETQRLGLGLAARLHDIGNLSLPKSLLMQPTVLSDAERSLMQSHVAYGVRLLNGIDLGTDVAGIVEQHHERVNGSGYPAALTGDQIRIEARILAVADVLDALSSARPHRAALTMQEALAEVRRGVGELFDAEVVTACEYLLATGKG